MFLINTPTWILLSPLLLIFGGAYFSAWYSRDTCDFKKSCFVYFPFALLIVVGFLFFGLDIVLGLFMIGVGFVALMYFSNRIFYRRSNDN